MIANKASASPAPNRLLTCWSSIANKNFYMDHVMLLQILRFIKLRTVKDDVTWLHFSLLQFDGQRVILIALVATSKHETELLPQITDNSKDQTAAVEEKRCVIQWIIRFSMPLSIRNTYIGLTLLYKELPQPIFELLCAIKPISLIWRS